ncbi:MAG: hypothetical protein WC370_08380 [Dehalococcoidales bacterium]|jgi:hypothetical protein
MRHVRKYCVLFLTALLLLSVGCTGSGTQYIKGASGAEAELVLATDLPDFSQTVMSYKILPPDVTEASAAALGAGFGFTGQAGPIDPGMIGMSNPEKQEIFQIFTASGAIEYTCLDIVDSLSPALPGNGEAVDIATEFLQSTGLWHADLAAGDAVVGGTFEGVTSHLLVRFTRYVNGYPLTGPGNKFGVRIGDKGKVIRLLARYDELAQDKEVQIIEPEVAYSKLQTGDGIFTFPVDCTKVVITDISLGYYLVSISERQDTLTPYYIFKGECRDAGDNLLEEFTGWVDAVSR